MEPCSATCLKNNGRPCPHMLRVYTAENTDTFAPGVIHPFWRLGKGEKEEENLDDESEGEDEFSRRPA